MKSVAELVGDLKSDKSDEVDSIEETFPLATREDKIEKAYSLKLRGIPVPTIATALKVTPMTVYRWLTEYVEKYKSEVEQQSGANLISETMIFYDNLERLCLYEITQVGEEEAVYDDETKLLMKPDQTRSKGLKLKYITAAAQCRRAKVELLLQTGVMPREPERIYHKMEDEKRIEDKEKKGAKRTKEEIIQNIVNVIERTRTV